MRLRKEAEPVAVGLGVKLGDGDVVGLEEGDGLGSEVGEAEGLEEGSGVAVAEGEGLGLTEGLGVALTAGFTEGLAEGEGEGSGVGSGVGLGEGEEASPKTSSFGCPGKKTDLTQIPEPVNTKSSTTEREIVNLEGLFANILESIVALYTTCK